MTRDYILSRQPWGFDSLPLQYIPMNQLRWFPPIFYLGVPLTFGEARQLATHLGLVLEGEDAHYVHYSVARRLSQLCGFTVPDSSYPLHRVTVKVCDTQGQPQMLAMVSNYQIPRISTTKNPTRRWSIFSRGRLVNLRRLDGGLNIREIIPRSMK